MVIAGIGRGQTDFSIERKRPRNRALGEHAQVAALDATTSGYFVSARTRFEQRLAIYLEWVARGLGATHALGQWK